MELILSCVEGFKDVVFLIWYLRWLGKFGDKGDGLNVLCLLKLFNFVVILKFF